MSDQSIATLFAERDRPLLSYEFFPPKSEKAYDSLKETIHLLKNTRPDFVTITYGAGGSTRERTFEIADLLHASGLEPVMPHLTCVGSSCDELGEIADEIYNRGFRNIMTLRGDPPKGETNFVPPADGLKNALELVQLLKARHGEFCCGVAGYPETHPEALSPESEIEYLKAKVDAGAGFITTQMFFDNSHYYNFVDQCRTAGIEVPILPGLMPAASLKQVKRITEMCGTTLPEGLSKKLEAAGGEGELAENAGIIWCVDQIVDLMKQDVPGIHLYILNRIRPALTYDLANAFMEMSKG